MRRKQLDSARAMALTTVLLLAVLGAGAVVQGTRRAEQADGQVRPAARPAAPQQLLRPAAHHRGRRQGQVGAGGGRARRQGRQRVVPRRRLPRLPAVRQARQRGGHPSVPLRGGLEADRRPPGLQYHPRLDEADRAGRGRVLRHRLLRRPQRPAARRGPHPHQGHQHGRGHLDRAVWSCPTEDRLRRERTGQHHRLHPPGLPLRPGAPLLLQPDEGVLVHRPSALLHAVRGQDQADARLRRHHLRKAAAAVIPPPEVVPPRALLRGALRDAQRPRLHAAVDAQVRHHLAARVLPTQALEDQLQGVTGTGPPGPPRSAIKRICIKHLLSSLGDWLRHHECIAFEFAFVLAECSAVQCHDHADQCSTAYVMSGDEDGVSLQRLGKQPQCVESQQPRVPEATALKDASTPTSGSVIRVYRRRWGMLGLYIAVICLNSVPYMQYTVVGNVLSKYFSVSKDDMEWMTMVSSATATLFIFPAAWVLDKYGLRVSVLVGAAGTAAGLWLKTLGCGQDGYWLSLAGQGLVSVATLFVVSSAPPRMAAVWFPPHQVASAVGAAYLVIMLGIAIGCAMAPLSVSADQSADENYYSLLTTNIGLAVVGTALLAAVYFVFQDKPPLPPSPSQAVRASPASETANNATAFFRSLRRIGRDPHFLLLLFACALFSSTLIAYSVLMNRTVVHFFGDVGAKHTSWIGMIMTLLGIVGIVIIGMLVDKTRLYKEWSVFIYVCALLSAAAYSVSVSQGTIVTVYVSASILGFFMPCFYVPGLALAVELTYPEPEGNPTAIINWLIQPTALLVKLMYSQLFEVASPDVAHMVQCSLLVAGLVCIACVPKKYRRRDAERLGHHEPVKNVKETNGSTAKAEDAELAVPEASKLTVVD